MKEQTTRPSIWVAMRKSLCPHCRKGDIFASFMRMNETCPVCGITYEREHGYFLMAIFIGYLLNAFLFAPFVLYFYFTDRLGEAIWPLLIGLAILSPLTFRYSRVLWLHMDEAMDPHR